MSVSHAYVRRSGTRTPRDTLVPWCEFVLLRMQVIRMHNIARSGRAPGTQNMTDIYIHTDAAEHAAELDALR